MMIWLLFAWNVLLTLWVLKHIAQDHWYLDEDIEWMQKAIWNIDNKDEPDYDRWLKKRR